MLLVGVAIVVPLAVGAVLLLATDDAPVRTERSDGGSTDPSDGDVAAPDTPAFHFEKVTRELLPTAPGRLKRPQRRAIVRAAAAARTALAELYTDAFLDPANWEQGEYAEAFRSFASGARRQAKERTSLLTAGARAGDRYEQILPISGRLSTRILLDRAGRPALLVSIVRFSADALGPEPLVFRSTGQFFFEPVAGSWKIVSFHITRKDTPGETA
jgi:hypothetical protein